MTFCTKSRDLADSDQGLSTKLAALRQEWEVPRAATIFFPTLFLCLLRYHYSCPFPARDLQQLGCVWAKPWGFPSLGHLYKAKAWLCSHLSSQPRSVSAVVAELQRSDSILSHPRNKSKWDLNLKLWWMWPFPLYQLSDPVGVQKSHLIQSWKRTES